MANYIKSLAIYFVAYLEINLFYVILKYNLNNLQKKHLEKIQIQTDIYKKNSNQDLTSFSTLLNIQENIAHE
jgi:hypothetical protein